MIVKKICSDDFEKLSKDGKALVRRALSIKGRYLPDEAFNYVYDNGENTIIATDTRIIMRVNGKSTGQKMLFNSKIARMDDDLLKKFDRVAKSPIFDEKPNGKYTLFTSFLQVLKQLLPYYNVIGIGLKDKKTLLYPSDDETKIWKLPILDLTNFITLAKDGIELYFNFSLFVKAFNGLGLREISFYKATQSSPERIGFEAYSSDFLLCTKSVTDFAFGDEIETFNYGEINEFAFLIRILIKNALNGGEISKDGDFIKCEYKHNDICEEIKIKSPRFANFDKERLNSIFQKKY